MGLEPNWCRLIQPNEIVSVRGRGAASHRAIGDNALLGTRTGDARRLQARPRIATGPVDTPRRIRRRSRLLAKGPANGPVQMRGCPSAGLRRIGRSYL